jgi:hypothetical protein
MKVLNSNTKTIKRKPGQVMGRTERIDFVGDMIEHMMQGLYSDNKLAKMLDVDRRTVVKYKPQALKLISITKLDQNNIRQLQIQRAYYRIEQLIQDLNSQYEYIDAEGKPHKAKLSIKDKMAVHNQITKLEQHLALIAGLNVETKVHVDSKQLVITRAHPDAVRKALNPETVIDVTPDDNNDQE